MRNLTESEARERATALTVSSYAVELDLTQGGERFGSTTTVRFTAEPGTSTFLELDGALLDEALLDGAPVGLAGNRIRLEDLAGEHEVVVRAQCAYTRSGEGLHRFVDPADDQVYVYAHLFLDNAQQVFACFDQPDLKAVFRLSVRAPEGHVVRSNARGVLDGGVHVFEPTPPLSTYHVTLAAGPWYGETAVHDGIELGVWCRQSMAAHLEAPELLEITAQCFTSQQAAFGSAYPFGDTYDQVFVPEFNAGAMENPGMVTFNDETFLFRSRTTEGHRRLRAQVIAHEMAHMWFGDLVTMRWWDGVWLNESFAEFMGLDTVDTATAYTGAWADFSLGRKAWGLRADQLPTTHPVAGPAPDTRSALLNFDGISYAKGASVLRQLVAFVGKDAFFDGLRAYLAEHAFGNTDLADLLAALTRASGRDLDAWAQSWLGTGGVSTLRPEWVDGTLRVRQTGAVLRDHVVQVATYAQMEDSLGRASRTSVEVSGAVTEVPGVEPADLVIVNDSDLTFAKMRFDDRSLDTVVRSLRRLTDPVARAVCWGALWDTCRDGELSAEEFVDAVLANVGVETDPSAAETLLSRAVLAATAYSVEPITGRIADACWAAPVAAGSDLQLMRIRAAISATSDAPRLLALLDGSDVPAGLVVDDQLRWHAVRRAACLAAVGEDEIGAELVRDHTASGELQAEAALASLPDPDVKERTWQALAERDDCTNSQARMMGSAFWQFGQDELLEPYVDRYIASMPGWWESRSPQVALFLTTHLFPHTLVRQDVIDRVGAVLDMPDLAAGARRVVLEQLDDLQRALRVRSP